MNAGKRPAASHREAELNRDNTFIIAALSFILRARGPRSSFLLRFLPAKDPLSTNVGGYRQPEGISVSLAREKRTGAEYVQCRIYSLKYSESLSFNGFMLIQIYQFTTLIGLTCHALF